MDEGELAVVVAEARAGDRAALAELYRRFGARIFGLCRHLLGTPEAAEDARGEVFLKLPGALAGYDPAQPFAPWLLSVASHHCLDRLRRRRLEARLFVPTEEEPGLAEGAAAPGPSPLGQLLLDERQEAVRAAITALPVHYRAPLVLRYYAELGYDDIAQTLGLGRNHVATLIFRAKHALRRQLQPVGPAGAEESAHELLPELTYALHADGELDSEARAAVDRHLAGCARCRELRAALEVENRVLAAALAAPAPAPVVAVAAPRPAWRAAALTGAVAAALALLLATGREASPASDASDWIGPAVQAALLLARHADTLNGLVPRLAGLATAAVALGALALLARRAPRGAVALLSLAALLLGGAPATSALETRTGRAVTVAAGDHVDGPLVVAADEVVVDGTVEGDLIALAGQVRIRGTVRGDVILAGRAAEIAGAVDGHVYALAGELAIAGRVTRSLYALARAVQLGPGGAIAGDVSVLGRGLALDGTVGRGAWGLVSVATVGGAVGRDLALRADRVAVRPPARVGGRLIVEVARAGDAAVDPAVPVGGARRITALAGERSGWAALHEQLASHLWTAARYVAAWLFGVALLALAPGPAQRSVEALGAWWPSLGTGLVTLLVVPVALAVAGLTVIGLPLALAGLALYALVVYTAPLVAGLFVGQVLLRRGARLRDAALALALGLGLLTAAFAVPAAGWALWLVAVAVGTGGLVRGLRAQGTSTVSVHPAPARR